MSDPARKPRSFDELYREILDLREGLTGEILEEGQLRVMSRPGKRHRRAALIASCLVASWKFGGRKSECVSMSRHILGSWCDTTTTDARRR